MTGPGRKAPLVIDLDAEALPPVPPPAEAPQPDEPPEGTDPAAARALRRAASRSGWSGGRLFVSLAAGFFSLWLSVTVWDFVTALFARAPLLGWVGAALLGAIVVVVVALILREAAALARLRRIEGLGRLAEQARGADSGREAARVLDGLDRLYADRTDLDWARAEISRAREDVPDAGGRLDIAERVWLGPLDARATAVIERSARDVAAATALIPLPAVDVLAALLVNLRMIRRIAEIYGGRAGWFGSWRLLRTVAGHLVATGAVAVTDDLIGPAIGGGLVGSVSRRFGEGALNGALTARVGVAAVDVCRPLPFVALDRPSSSGLVVGALRGWRRKDAPGAGSSSTG